MTTTAFEDGGVIPDKYTQKAGPMAVSPELKWSQVPMGTQTFVLLMHDPEPVLNKSSKMDVTHWLVWNIPGNTNMLPENVPSTSSNVPSGAMQSNGNANGPNLGFRPPCPPAGPPHHYAFELYALDSNTNLPANATRDDVTKAMDGHILGHSVMIGYYNR